MYDDRWNERKESFGKKRQKVRTHLLELSNYRERVERKGTVCVRRKDGMKNVKIGLKRVKMERTNLQVQFTF